MHTLWQRANTMSTVMLSVTAVITSVLALSTGYYELWTGLPEPIIDLEVGGIRPLGYIPKEKGETAVVGVKLDADMTGLWHWNVKQLFIYVVAESRSPGRIHEVVLYDYIMREPEVLRVGFSKRQGAYDYHLVGKEIEGHNFTLKVKWNVMPHSGVLYYQEQAGEKQFSIPKRY
eukprot:TRINITY_DN1781_c0_g1_i1.p1 TRINITY_DN1781_c0_g1~~TRINITY_DN1781_c0_g1_i1.p1  ORF type:complete len:174 (+),score=29.89 TRINITY_DN1781_c0_g1_i1:34-555(+)